MKKFRATIAFLLCCTLFLYGTTSLVFAAEITTTSHLSKANLIDNIAHNDMSISTEDLSEAQALIDRGACSALLPFSDIVSNRSTTALSKETQGTISSEGTMNMYGIISLGPNQILQAGLECPASSNLDYDLYLGELDSDNNVTLVAGSQYTTYIGTGMTKTLDEGADYINTASTYKDYVVIVHAKKGASATDPYTVYYSIDIPGQYLSGENDQNAAYPCNTLNIGDFASGAPLNSPSDVDWYQLNVDVNLAYRWKDISLEITDISTGAICSNDSVELYEHIGNNQLRLMPKINGLYRFEPQTGTYYIRVSSINRAAFDWHQYKLAVSIKNVAASAQSFTITKLSTDLDTSGTDYVPWPQGNGYCLRTYGGWFRVDGQLKDGNGNALTDTTGMNVKVTFINRYWDSHNVPSLARKEGQGTINNNGAFQVTLNNMPSPSGEQFQYYNSASKLTHKYDLADVTVTVTDTKTGAVLETKFTVYHHHSAS
ncbi:MAG: hypothetical protein HDQ87_04455 [Clostridia bacterium]|nr:hypothetical protein [Clostridia bacterium]MBD5559598.1 hypothetical protein [Clostridia bacterium]